MPKIRHKRESRCELGVSGFSWKPRLSRPAPPLDDYTKLNGRASSSWGCVYISARFSVPDSVSIWVLKSGLQWRRFSLLFASPQISPLSPFLPSSSGSAENCEFLLAICVQITLLLAVCCFQFAFARMWEMCVCFIYTFPHRQPLSFWTPKPLDFGGRIA